MTSSASESTPLHIDPQRLLDRLRQLGNVGAVATGGVSRLALTQADKAGRDLVVSWMRELGLQIHCDRIGNVVGVTPGAHEVIMMGSHIDSVEQGGTLDGPLGVLAGLEVIARLQEIRPASLQWQGLAVAFFTNEEGVRYAPDMMGSLVMVGGLDLEEARSVVGIDGERLGDSLDAIGYTGNEPFDLKRIRAFLELHIEQGPVLEREGRSIGVVTGVQGIHWLEVAFQGEARHAGTTPMSMRKDAGAAAMALAEFARNLALATPGQLATAGRLLLEPNLVNVVARRATLTLDLRNTSAPALRQAVTKVREHAESLASERGLRVTFKPLVDLEPVVFDTELAQRIEATAARLGLSTLRLASGAGHDAQMMARACRAAMIFVPSIAGISHNPREATAAADLVAGADVLLNVVAEMSAAAELALSASHVGA